MLLFNSTLACSIARHQLNACVMLSPATLRVDLTSSKKKKKRAEIQICTLWIESPTSYPLDYGGFDGIRSWLDRFDTVGLVSTG